MKTIDEILKQEPVFLNDWKQDGKFKLIADFEDVYISKEEFEAAECPISNREYWIEKKNKMQNVLPKYDNKNILFASYGNENYEGDAWVLFEENGKLYEVNGGHCSCYGLEGQFDPEETNLEAIRFRLEKGNLGNDGYSGNEFAKELKEFLGL
ncbi:hypothetical protein H0S70_07275 [Chryseobacterium manosquense]|uniref:Uncharacterized protein n=1 Tax=Chryseobacterium manosquense TaxID=2754694 RepID=A0A7H1DT98_9FLAO|nr:hypothetical protein [Chryseobacterium manosquense]QNS40206.1 hypothetical protein H0S70_07275 [Chryseobacterium manosquense]